MTIKVETEDPGVSGVRAAVEKYRGRFPQYSDSLGFYGAIMEVQQKALDEVECAIDLSHVDVDGRLREGKPILDVLELEIPPRDLLRVAGEICAAMEERGALGGRSSKEFLSWMGQDRERIEKIRKMVLAGQGRLEDLPGAEGVSGIPVEGIVWESLAPFLRKCAASLEGRIDHSLWLRGYCPICGGNPLMGVYEAGGGRWMLECSLCHSLWNVKRASCPFCRDSEEGSLEYFYPQDERSYRVQYCKKCGNYIKTVDLREKSGGAMLPLDNIVTELMGLDRAAEQEGLKPAPAVFS
jgi:FdhE protein